MRAAGSVTEEEEHIDPRLLDAAFADSVGRAGGLRRAAQLHPQESSELIVQQEFRGVVLAELRAGLDECPVADLLPNGQPGPELAFIVCRGDLEQIEIERPSSRFAEWGGEETGGDAAGGVGERCALAGTELVDRTVEDDEREDVRLL